ncbi:MAG TPA: hypothetical protein DD979_10860 [Gammaproteobacteria bacterium]|nr:hypothetical protein [Gammaproteobacteria bacterium]
MHNAHNPLPEQVSEASPRPDQQWVTEVSTVINPDNDTLAHDYCQLKCRMIQRHLTLIYPHDLADKHPGIVQYLIKFAERNGLKLLRDRRVSCDAEPPLVERRREEAPILALGVGVLLQQTGLTGTQHLHLAEAEAVPQVSADRFAKLFKIAETVGTSGKAVVVNSNRFLSTDKGATTPVTGRASKVVKGDESRTFSYFFSDHFRALGYTQKTRYVMHAFAGGGHADSASLWGPLAVMTREPLHCRLYHTPEGESYGLLYASYSLDLERDAASAAWWQRSSASNETS